MQWLASLVEDVIGNIDDIIDGTLAGRFDRVLEPLRAGANLHTFDASRGVVRADIGRADFNAGNERFAGAGAFGAGFDFRVFHREAETSGELASDADVAEHIDTVWRNLKVQHGVTVGVEIVDRRAERCVLAEDHDAVVVLTDLKFFRRAHHASRWLAAQLRRLDLEIARQHGSRERNHDLVALHKILGTTDDVVDFALVASGHLAAAQAIGIGVLSEL